VVVVVGYLVLPGFAFFGINLVEWVVGRWLERKTRALQAPAPTAEPSAASA